MAKDLMRYDRLLDGALRGVMVEALRRTAEKGLPGGHHFKISFRTERPGVEISADLKARYPEELTIVLQHQFWDLEVDEKAFAVTLSFGGVPQRIRVPLDTVTAFADPSVKFGLQFKDLDRPVTESDESGETQAADGEVAARESGSSDDTESTDAKATDHDPATSGGGEVVTLDAFRKK